MAQLFDLIAALLGMVALAPLFLAVSLAIVLDSPGPVLYRARRVGLGGRLFDLYKFRSMVVSADQLGPGITTASDGRITRVGRLLRQWKIDELPQLVNVLKGEMRLVGPRPEDPRYVALYSAEQRRVLDVRPGITGAAALHYRHEEQLLTGKVWEQRYVEQIMPRKIEIEIEYLEHRTFFSDMRLLIRTCLAILR